jgi:hypothetical protein
MSGKYATMASLNTTSPPHRRRERVMLEVSHGKPV